MLLFDLPVHGDNRGWFKENWQREKMLALGLPDFGPVQNNISFNDKAGTTRGIHAEPWDKFVSVATGRIFGAWVDLREGPTFGAVFTAELDAGKAIFIPRGVANSYQTLEDNTSYVYLVNDHWSADAEYTFLNLADETVSIPGPFPWTQAELSDKDKAHPRLKDVVPMPPRDDRWCWAPTDSWARRCAPRTKATRAWSSRTAADFDLSRSGVVCRPELAAIRPSSTPQRTPRWMRPKRTRAGVRPGR